MLRTAHFRVVVLIALLVSFCGRSADGYSLLTHEQLIDLTWKDSIVPLLLSRYPTLTPAELEHARAYAYGGCVIQDIGYYPLGDKSFSNLTHYVRSGDFVVNLFRNAGNADELAFAVGALSHYIGDSLGHSLATNLAVPVEFPALAAKYGKSVSYAEGEHQHVQTEFAFDIDQVAHGRMAPLRFLNHVGMQVPLKQLALAYYQTYGLTEDFNVHRGRRINVRAYRFSVRAFIPRIAYAVTILHRRHEPTEPSTLEVKQMEAEVARISSENDWDAYRRKAGIGTYALAGFLWILPKIGPLKLVDVKGPTEATEAEYVHSLIFSEGGLRGLLARFTPPPATRGTAAKAAASDANSEPPPGHPLAENRSASQDVPRESRDPRHPLKNRDLDTGNVVKPGGYSLTDATYADLLHRIASTPDHPIPPGIKEDVLEFYANPDAPDTTKKTPAQWAEVQADLATLKAMKTSPAPEPYPTYGDLADDGQ